MKGDFSRNTYKPQKQYHAVRMQQGRVLLDADWNEMVDIFSAQHTAALHDMIGAHGGLGDGFRVTFAEKATSWIDENATATDSPTPILYINAGQYYANGYSCTLAETISFETQPFFPGAEEQKEAALVKEDSDQWLVYLEVWERHLTAIEDPELPEPALGGADTTTRTQMMWRVKILPIINRDQQKIDSHTFGSLPEWQHLIRFPNHSIKITKKGYITENELFRIEVHTGNDDGKANHEGDEGMTGPALKHPTWKWSRDNASIAFPLEEIEADMSSNDGNLSLKLTLAANPRLQEQLHTGDCVELECDFWTLNGLPGLLGRIKHLETPDENQFQKLVVTVPGSISNHSDWYSLQKNDQHPLIRRWDQEASRAKEADDGFHPLAVHSTSQVDRSTLEFLLAEDQITLNKEDWVDISGMGEDETFQIGQVTDVTAEGELRRVRVALAQPLEEDLTVEGPSGKIELHRWGSLDLAYGITVQFPPGRYRSGDYWLIPARSDARSGSLTVPQANSVHAFAPLALLTREISVSEATWKIIDLRRAFLDLGDIFNRLESLRIEVEDTKQKLEDLQAATHKKDEEHDNEISALQKDVSNLRTKMGLLPILTIQRYIERYRSQEKLEPGDVVASQGGLLLKASRDVEPVGVIAPRSEDLEADEYSVVLSGPVLCRVQGPVEADDLLVPAWEPGALERASLWVRWFAPNRIVARAIDNPTSPRDHLINVYFMPDFTSPED